MKFTEFNFRKSTFSEDATKKFPNCIFQSVVGMKVYYQNEVYSVLTLENQL